MTQVTGPDLGDIPIGDAMVLWNLAPPIADGRVKVVPCPDDRRLQDLLDLGCSWGACDYAWEGLTPSRKVDELIALAWKLTICYKLKAEDVHNALSVIPEYRADPIFNGWMFRNE